MNNYKIQRIDQSIINEYEYLDEDDNCYFFGEYAGQQGYDHSEMNQLIFNFKKPMKKKGLPDWQYKLAATKDIPELIYNSSAWEKLKGYLWVPMPPSKIKEDPDYDDRLVRVLHKLNQKDSNFNFIEILDIRKNRLPAHLSKQQPRPTKQDHLVNITVNRNLRHNSPIAIILFDDVIRSGASFKAAKEILQKHFLNVPIFGLFVARHVSV